MNGGSWFDVYGNKQDETVRHCRLQNQVWY